MLATCRHAQRHMPIRHSHLRASLDAIRRVIDYVRNATAREIGELELYQEMSAAVSLFRTLFRPVKYCKTMQNEETAAQSLSSTRCTLIGQQHKSPIRIPPPEYVGNK